MRIKFLRNASYPQNNPADSREYKAGEIHDLPDDHAKRWLRRNAAIDVSKPATVKSTMVEKAPVTIVEDVPDEDAESPVDGLSVDEAVGVVGRMRSKDKLAAVIASDKHVTVKRAAQERLDALNAEE